jgi:electron transfer flavoprotein beta subunit
VKVVVILRNAPDPLEELPLAEGGLDWDEVAYALDIFDDCALEEAALLKEETGAEVIALGLAKDGVRLLQTAIARGADRAVRVEADVEDGVSSRSLAPVLAEAMRNLGADLVVTGVQAPGDLAGQLVPFLGAELGWPEVNGVLAIEADGNRARVRNDQGAGRVVVLSVALPAVLGVQTSRRPPSYVSGTKLRKAIEAGAISTLKIDAVPAKDAVEIVEFIRPPRDRAVERLADDPDVAAGQIARLLENFGNEAQRDV